MGIHGIALETFFVVDLTLEVIWWDSIATTEKAEELRKPYRVVLEKPVSSEPLERVLW